MILRAAFICFVLLFLLLQLLQYFSIGLPNWVVFYVNDFLCMPIVLFICLQILKIFTKDPSQQLPYLPALVLTIFYSVYFELILPQFTERYTSDFLDVIMYMCGSLIFLLLQEINASYYRKRKKLPER